MLGGADPQDTQYSDMLKREQTSIIEQLKQLDAQMKAAPAQPALPPLSQPPLNAPGAGIGALGAPLGGNYGDQPPTLPENWQSMSPEALSQYFVAQQQQQRASVQPPQMPQPSHTAQPPQLPFPQPQAAANESQQIMEIVQRLRESGLNDLADQTLANWQREMQARGLPSNMPTAPAAATPPIAPPPTMTPPAGFTPAVPPGNLTPSLWQPQSPQDVAELKETITKLHQQVDQLQKDVKAMETQLQLLNRNILLNQQK